MIDSSPSVFNINNIFWTFQGEGQHAGTRALFVRMPYCNLACSWCDTEFNSHSKWTKGDFQLFARKEKARFAVITGGEPMMNKHTPAVISSLKELGFYIACETNGNFPIFEGIDFATCSPKRDAKPDPYYVHSSAWPKVAEFKYVVDDQFDFSVLDRHDVKDGRRYSLSPEFNQMQKSLYRIYEYIEHNPQWKLNLQTHKWVGIP